MTTLGRLGLGRLGLGRLGVWSPIDRLDAAGLRRLAAVVEDLGYGALWYPEARGYESFTAAGFLLAASRRMVVGSSIANIYARDAFTARRGMLGLNALHGGRFVLGLGVSNPGNVEALRGHVFAPPVPAMRAYLDALHGDAGDAGEWPVALGAVGPRMLALAGARTRGALPYSVTPAHTAMAAGILGPGRWLAVEQKVCLETDAARARALGRAELARHMALPADRANWLRLGFTEDDLRDGGSDRFIDAMVLWGEADRIRAGVRAHFAAGATHVCLQPLADPADPAGRERVLRLLADC